MTDKVTFEPIGRMPRLSDTIAEQLLEAILTGDFKVGDILPSERALSLQFGVSRTIIREAIRSLSVKGIVQPQSGRGVEVVAVGLTPVTEAMSLLFQGSQPVGFQKIHEVRMMLETYAAGVAAERARQDELASLGELYRRMVAANELDDPSPDTELDITFHRLIACAAHNALYLVLLDSISAVQLDARRRILTLYDDPYPFVDDHRKVLDALVRRDPVLAREAMTECLNRVRDVWHEHFADDE